MGKLLPFKEMMQDTMRKFSLIKDMRSEARSRMTMPELMWSPLKNSLRSNVIEIIGQEDVNREDI